MSVIFISHKLNEVLEISDRITVLRRGKTVETVPARARPRESLARLMVGREVLLRVDKATAAPTSRPRAWRACRSSTTGVSRLSAGSPSRCAAGEIVGIAGVDGNGQSELIDAITGLRQPERGARQLLGRGLDPRDGRASPRRGPRAHPRGSPAARTRARVHAGREPRAARLRRRRSLASAGLSAAPDRARRASCSSDSTFEAAARRRRPPPSPAETSRRWISRGKSRGTRGS